MYKLVYEFQFTFVSVTSEFSEFGVSEIDSTRHSYGENRETRNKTIPTANTLSTMQICK